MIEVIISMIFTLMLTVGTGLLLRFEIAYYVKGRKSPNRSRTPLRCSINKDKAQGIIFGKKGPMYYYSPAAAEGHVFVGGGSGTGKTSALLIPTLRSWNGASFTIDISGDISANVENNRKLVYEPMAASSAPYNIFGPIDDLQDDADRVEALAQLAWLIMPELQHSSANADYFQNGGRAILTAALIWGYHVGLDFIQICETITEWKCQEMCSRETPKI